MADTVRELILKNRATVLATITVVNGYDNTIALVQRFKAAGQKKATTPLLLLGAGVEEAELGNCSPIEMIDKHLEVYVGVIHRLAGSDTRNADEVLNSLLGDVEKAWATDVTCGGYALDSHLMATYPIAVEEGDPELQQLMKFSVDYRHRMTDPKTATT